MNQLTLYGQRLARMPGVQYLAYLPALLLVVFLLSAASCANQNPIAAAETDSQRAYAVEASYNIVLDQALNLVKDPNVPESVKETIRRAEVSTTPAVNGLSEAYHLYTLAQADLAAAALDDPDRPKWEAQLLAAADNLSVYLTRGQRALSQLSQAVKRGDE